MDVDDEADLRLLLQQDLSGTRTGAWLSETGIRQRLCGEGVATQNVAAQT